MESTLGMPYNKSVRFLRDRSGQGVLEYGLILGLLAMVAIGALLMLGNDSNSSLVRAGHSINAGQTLGTGDAPPTSAP